MGVSGGGGRGGVMSFSGWPEEALDFYEDLEIDNSKAYWTAHKAVYEEKILGPMADLVDELALEFGEPKIFRPYRDLRFSKDKSPYKTSIASRIGSGYVQLSAKGLAAGDGMYHMTPGQLDSYRRSVASDDAGGELERIIAGIEGCDITVTSHDALKSAPRGYPADHPRIRLLRYKGLIAWKEWPVQPWLGTAEAKDRIAGFLRTTRPLGAWLHRHAGPEQSGD
jgi:uncharacterized protein (TIGR02453 family)